MKKLFLLLALCGMVTVGCTEGGVDDNIDNGGNNTEQPDNGGNEDESDIPENIFFGLDKESATISPDGGSVDVTVYSNYKWEISGTSDWCTPSITKGDANEDGQKVTFSADVAYDDREATFWFRCADEKIKVVVSQKLKKVIIPDANNSFDISAEGGIAVISYKTSVDCEVIIPDEAQDWITIAPATRGLVSEDINLDIAENTTYDPRTAVIKVVAKDNAELVVEYTINQVQNDAIIPDENNTFNLKGWDQSIKIAYQTNVECEVVIPEEAKSWISFAPATRALVNESAKLNIAENNTGAERSAVVKVVAANNNELVAEYTITQNQRYFMEYTSQGGTVRPYDSSAFNATIIRNEYIDGKGYIDFDAPITSIGDSAFSNCYLLTSVTIPDSITSIGDSAFSSCLSLTRVYITDIAAWCNISFVDYSSNPLSYAENLYLNNELVTDLIIPDGVTKIDSYAFCNCTSLTSVTIPDSVTSIGGDAFYGCDSLTSITIPDSVTSIGGGAFSDCTSLTSVTIGNGVTSISGGAFQSCDSLTSVTIPDSVTSIGGGAFSSCYSLTSITIPDSVTSIGNSAFNNCDSLTSVTIPDSVTSIGNSAFNNCDSLTSVTIGNGVTSIGDYAFSYCTSLTSITIGNSVTSIGDSALSGCTSLTSVTIPNSVIKIGGNAFSDCVGELIIDSNALGLYGGKFTKVIIGDSVTSIERYAFGSCKSLTSVTIGNSVTSIGESAFQYCTSLTSVTIGDSVTSIERYAFDGCTSLTSITIGNSVTSIGYNAFRACKSLTSVTIPDSVTSIGESAFSFCSSLTSITIPDSVTSIGSCAFWSCMALSKVYCKPITPPTGSSAMFSYMNTEYIVEYSEPIGCKIYVPSNSVKAYKSAEYWKNYASDIEGYDF